MKIDGNMDDALDLEIKEKLLIVLMHKLGLSEITLTDTSLLEVYGNAECMSVAVFVDAKKSEVTLKIEKVETAISSKSNAERMRMM